MTNENQLDVGQEFAIRWMLKNRPINAAKGQLSMDEEISLCQDIASAANAYAEKKRAEFDKTLRTLMMGVLDGTHSVESGMVCERDFLESECMKFVARNLPTNSPFNPPQRFPINLHS